MDVREEWVSFPMWNGNPSYGSGVRYIHQPATVPEDVALANLHYCYYTPWVAFLPPTRIYQEESFPEPASDFLSTYQG